MKKLLLTIAILGATLSAHAGQFTTVEEKVENSGTCAGYTMVVSKYSRALEDTTAQSTTRSFLTFLHNEYGQVPGFKQQALDVIESIPTYKQSLEQFNNCLDIYGT